MNIVKMAIAFIVVFIPILTFVLFFFASSKEKVSAIVTTLEKKIKEKNKGYFNYNNINKKLSKYGMYYMFDNSITPVVFILTKLIMSVVGFLICLKMHLSLPLSIIVIIFSFFAFDILMKVSNDKDNEAMMTDIKNMFDLLAIQTKAGVYITYSLNECYRNTENKRLRVELLNLYNEITTHGNVVKAVSNFEDRFNNFFISNMCITLIQSQQSGYSLSMMHDLSKQVSEMQDIINLKRENSLDRKIDLIELLIMVGLIAICVYGLFFEAASNLGSIM